MDPTDTPQQITPVELVNAINTKLEVGKSYTLNVSDLHPNPEQVRTHFDQEKLKELTESIKADGLLQGITFTKIEDKLVVVAGERRFKAAKEAKLEIIPGTYVEGDLCKLALLENIKRENITVVECSENLKKLRDKYNDTQEEIGKIIGLKKNTVSEILRIASLPESIRDKARIIPELTRDALLKIAKIDDSKIQEDAFNRLLKQYEDKQKAITEEKETTSKNTKTQTAMRTLSNLSNKIKTLNPEKLKFAESEEKSIFIKSIDDLIAEAKKLKKSVAKHECFAISDNKSSANDETINDGTE